MAMHSGGDIPAHYSSAKHSPVTDRKPLFSLPNTNKVSKNLQEWTRKTTGASVDLDYQNTKHYTRNKKAVNTQLDHLK